jgi:hypothetical protein
MPFKVRESRVEVKEGKSRGERGGPGLQRPTQAWVRVEQMRMSRSELGETGELEQGRHRPDCGHRQRRQVRDKEA